MITGGLFSEMRLDYLCDPVFSRFSRTPTCDRCRHRQTQTQGHSIYRACIASRRICDIYDFFAPRINALTYLLTYHAVKIESTAHYAPQTEKYIHRHTTYVNYEQTDVP